MKRIYPATAACCIIPAIILCWHILTAGNAKWLGVETSPFAIKGENFNIQVTLTSPGTGLHLGADIHGMNINRESTGYITGSRNIEVIPDKKLYKFSLAVPADKNISFIFPVIILSKDGTWGGRISAAETGPVPVRLSGDVNDLEKLEFKNARNTAEKGAAAKPESLDVSLITSLILIAAAAAAVFYRKQFSQWITAAVVVTAVWELFNSSTTIVNILRTAALGSGIYSGRRLPQQVLAIAIILIVTAAVYWLIVSGFELYIRISWLSIISYWVINFLQVLSLHEADMLLSLTVAGIQTGQLIKLAAAFICLIFLAAKGIKI